MPIFVNKPEFALRRAEEFLDVGKRVRALEALTEAIKNRKHRIWQKSHEDIMRKFIQLCVELRQSQTAKEGLHQYKNLTANVNPKSLEDIIRYYLKLSELKCDEAREKANAQVGAGGGVPAAPGMDVDDLDLAESPEGMLLKVVSTDTSQDRADRVVLLPWVRFNWEAYRHCLDLLRNLSKLEALYHDIASQAFKFCLKYQRKTELRKLCEMLRNHIGQISKREVVTANAINLNNPETQELNLRTRLVQLDHAIAMEMWQEAFRAIEDVHGLMSMLKKVPKAALKANYFEKLALVFLRAGNAVFHAAAQHQLFSLYRNFRKDLNIEELRKLAVTVLFATLAVPLQPPRTHLESLLEYDDTAANKMKQLTMLVGYNQPPNRTKLVEDLQKLGILQHVRPELQTLYHYLEVAFDPLNMGNRVAEVLEVVNSAEELSPVRHYVKVIEEVAVGKQLRQLSQAFDSIGIDRVVSLMPYTKWHTIERVAIETARNTDLEVRIDHRPPKLFVFGSDVALAPYESDIGEITSDSQIPTDRVRSQLVMLLTSLTRTHRITKSQNDLDEETRVRQQLFQLYRKNAMRDHLQNLQRPVKTDNRQKYLEEREREKEQMAQAAKKSKDKESAVAETLRMQRDTRQFEEQRNKLKEKELEKQVIREKLEKMKQTEYGMRVLKELTDVDIENIDVKDLEKLEQRHREELKREEEENNTRLKLQEKKIDHTVRAKHLEEVELRKEDNQRQLQTFRDIWAQDENRRILLLHEDREFMLKKREKMKRIIDERTKFFNDVQQRKRELYEDKMGKWEKKFKEEKTKRLAERRKEREKTRREDYERRVLEEETRRVAEEEKRRKEEEAERKRVEAAELAAKLKEAADKQRERERVVEEKLALEKQEMFRRPLTRVQPAEVWRGSAATSSAPVGVAAAGMESSRPVIVLERSEQPPSSVAPAAGRFDSLRGSDRGRADMNAGPYGGPPRDEGAPRQYNPDSGPILRRNEDSGSGGGFGGGASGVHRPGFGGSQSDRRDFGRDGDRREGDRRDFVDRRDGGGAGGFNRPARDVNFSRDQMQRPTQGSTAPEGNWRK